MSGFYYVGIDPGAIGGIAVVDGNRQFIAAHRWKAAQPFQLFQLLQTLKGNIYNRYVYLERIQAHPDEGVGHVTNNLPLVENFGLWQGFIIAAGLIPILIHPQTWQSSYKLRNWKKVLEKYPDAPTPLSKARKEWPSAPLQFGADDGKAVALLLAALAHKDHAEGIDRAAINEERAQKAKVERAKARRKRRQLRESGKGWLHDD